MSQKRPVNSPGKYVSPTAIGFSNGQGEFAPVTSDAPLPVMLASTAGVAPARPLAGTARASTIAGPFSPTRATPIHLQLSGTWEGTVALERSTDGGKTRQGVTVGGLPWARFFTNANEPVWQESGTDASFWLNVELASGEVNYRLSQ